MARSKAVKNAKTADKKIQDELNRRSKKLALIEKDGLNNSKEVQSALDMMTADIKTIYNSGQPKNVPYSDGLVTAKFSSAVGKLKEQKQELLKQEQELADQKQLELENSSATKIQKTVRGHIVRSSLKTSSEKYTILATRAEKTDDLVVAALYKEAARLHLKAETSGGISGYLWGSAYQAKALAVDRAIEAIEDISNDSVTAAMTEHKSDSGLYNALNGHSSYIFKFSTGSYGVPASTSSRAVLNINNVIDANKPQVEEVAVNESVIS